MIILLNFVFFYFVLNRCEKTQTDEVTIEQLKWFFL